MTIPGPQHHSHYGPQQPWPPSGGVPQYPDPQRPSRGPLLIAAAIIAAAVAVSAILVVNRHSDTASSRAASASTAANQTATTAAAPALVRVVPSTLLPTADQVRAATLIDVRFVGDLSTKVHADAVATPPQCTITLAAASQSAWGTAISAALQRWGDGPDEPHSSNSAGAGVAVFDTAEAATDSFTKVSDSVHGCTAYTRADQYARDGTSAWTVSDVQGRDDRLSWTDTESAVTKQWQCAKTYRVHANVAAYALVCGSNPGDGAANLADLIMTNATKS